VHWLIDGYNVLRRDPDLVAAERRGLAAGRRALLWKVAAVARRSPDRFTVVFDGAPGPGPARHGGRLEVLFARPPERADDVLVRAARQQKRGAVIVTSDRTVATAARRAGAVVVSAEAFLEALEACAPDDGATEATTVGEGDVADAGPRSGGARDVHRVLRRLALPPPEG
jgi:predicted RNA-binding protein with PIN domain